MRWHKRRKRARFAAAQVVLDVSRGMGDPEPRLPTRRSRSGELPAGGAHGFGRMARERKPSVVPERFRGDCGVVEWGGDRDCRTAFRCAPPTRRLPLGTLPYFEAAGRRESFKKAADELCRTPTAVGSRIKALESAFGFSLFDRYARGVRLTPRGRAFLADVRRILGEIEAVTDRHRGGAGAGVLRIVAVEVLAERWLIPRLTRFRNAYPEISIRFETDHRAVDPGRRQFDAWVTFTGEVNGGLHVETLFEVMLVPVCSPDFLAERGRPETPADLFALPLLYDLAWEECWSVWLASHGVPAPDLSQASGFRLYSTVIQAAVSGIGVALGYSRMIESELEQGKLVRLLDSPVLAPARYMLVTPPGSENRWATQVFRSRILEQAGRLRHRNSSGARDCPSG